MEEQKKVEYVLGALIIILLLIVMFLAINLYSASSPNTNSNPDNKPQSNSIVISNSYNTITYNYNEDENYYKKDYDREQLRDYNTYKENDYLEYDSHGEHKKTEGVFGQRISRYDVYVENEEKEGGYFTVEFYFYDYKDKLTKKTSLTKYIPAREEKLFRHQVISEDRYLYDSWEYKVISHSRIY